MFQLTVTGRRGASGTSVTSHVAEAGECATGRANRRSTEALTATAARSTGASVTRTTVPVRMPLLANHTPQQNDFVTYVM